MRFAIFDFDGTIIDSMPMWRNMGNIFLKENGFPPLKYQKKLQNDTWEVDFLNEVNKQLGLEISSEFFFKWFSDYVIKAYGESLPLKPTAYEFLEKLQQNNVKMCICSSTHRFMMEPALKRLDLFKFFEFTCHCNDFGAEKDKPDIYLHCMEKLGCTNPAETVVFEDALYAAETTAKAGFYTVGIADTTEPEQRKMQQICHQYITNFDQLDWSKLPL